MRPLNFEVAVIILKEEGDKKSTGGIILATKSEPLQKGVVKFVSNDVTSVVPEEVVLFPTGSGVPVPYNGVEYRLIDVRHIKAII